MDHPDSPRDKVPEAPEALLAWTAARWAPRVALATGFGAEGCVLVDMIARARLPIGIFTLDTGVLFPETLALWRRLEERYGVVIRAERPLDAPDRLWERDPERCCEIRKVRPLERALSGLDAWVTAIRRDQTPDRASAGRVEDDGRFGIVKVNPLVAWTAEDVAAYVRAHDVPVNPLHARGYPSIGCHPCTTPVAPGESARAGRWRGLAKTECGLHLPHAERTV